MRKLILILGCSLFICQMSLAQKGQNLTSVKSISEVDMKKDVKLSNKGVAKKMKTVAVTKTALHFKEITVGKALAGKGMQERVGSTTWAILDGVDDELMQSLADEFYHILNQKLQNAGYQTVDWETVTAAKAYEKLSDKEASREMSSKEHGAAQTFTAFNGANTKQLEGNIGTWSQYGKLAKELNAFPLAIDLFIDFAVFDIDLRRRRGYKYTETTASAHVVPEISIKPYLGGETLPIGYAPAYSNISVTQSYGKSTIININKNVSIPGEIASSIDGYSGKLPKKMKRWISIGDNLTTGTFVIHADPELFRKAVLNALSEYTDVLIAKMLEVKK